MCTACTLIVGFNSFQVSHWKCINFFSEGDGVGGVGLQYTDRRLYGDQAGFFLKLYLY